MDKWPVAVALIVAVGAITIVAIAKYPANEALQIWSALAAIVGVITGGIGSYFFTERTITRVEQEVGAKEKEAREARQSTAELGFVLREIAGRTEPDKFREFMADPTISAALASHMALGVTAQQHD